jgi:hypothetical protein
MESVLVDCSVNAKTARRSIGRRDDRMRAVGQSLLHEKQERF